MRNQLILAGVAAVVISNVAGNEVESQLRSMATELHLPMEILPNGLLACGLNASAYQDPAQLGVDRASNQPNRAYSWQLTTTLAG